jgi:5-methylthioadenosine/S-adenosylhomocysteine deaminase
VLGLDKELGSIEAGKQADLITVNLFQPHLYPNDMLVYRLVYNATGGDVVDVAVAGRLVMEARKITTIDEAAVLERSQAVYARFVERADLAALTKNPEGFWGASRSSDAAPDR